MLKLELVQADKHSKNDYCVILGEKITESQ